VGVLQAVVDGHGDVRYVYTLELESKFSSGPVHSRFAVFRLAHDIFQTESRIGGEDAMIQGNVDTSYFLDCESRARVGKHGVLYRRGLSKFEVRGEKRG
jgi:hypothetical protein